MKLENLIQRLSRKAKPEVLAAAALAAIVGMDAGRLRLAEETARRAADIGRLDQALDDASDALGEAIVLRDLKDKDLRTLKSSLMRVTRSRRALYESGLQLQEDKRLLEKQWEIMTTYLQVDEEARKVSVMRGDQALVTYPIGRGPETYGGESRPAPAVVRIVSKERFAHPERGKSEQVNGKLEYEPPQVGQSVRANALGEFVIFTDGPLILHGPPKRPKEHALFAHACLNLPLAVAKRLYEKTFIGTKILIKAAPRTVAPLKAEAP